MKLRVRNHLAEWHGGGLRWWHLALVLAVLALGKSGAVQTEEYWLEDLRTDLLTPNPPATPSRVTVVTIGDDSFNALRRSTPIDRAFLAHLLQHVLLAKPLAVGLDILIDQASEPAKDEQLAAVLAAARAPVVIAAPDPRQGYAAEWERAFAKDFVTGLHNDRVNLAPATFARDADGTVRSFDTKLGDQTTFAALLAEKAGTKLEGGEEQQIAWRGVPEAAAINSLGAQQLETAGATVAPAMDATLRDHVVLIGVAGTNHGLRLLTPFTATTQTRDHKLPDVMIQANVVDQLINGRRVAPGGLDIGLALAVAMAFAGYRLGRFGKGSVPNLPWRIGLAVLYLAIGIALFAWCGRDGGPGPVLPILAPLAVMEAAHGLGQTISRIRSRRILTSVMPPEEAKRLFRNRLIEPNSGEIRELTILFTDLEGSSKLAWMKQAGQTSGLAEMLGDYLAGTEAIVHEEDGTVDKFIGDGTMAFWNHPAWQPDHVVRALKAVCRLTHYADKFRRTATVPGLDWPRTRFGLHVAEVWVGLLGGEKRFQYTAIGHGVNVAKILEGAARCCESGVVVSAAVRNRCDPAFAEWAFRALPDIRDKTGQVVEAYELICNASPPEGEKS